MVADHAVNAPALFDGITLPPAESWSIKERRMTSVREAKRGRRVEQIPLPPPGLPEVTFRNDFRLSWSKLPQGAARDQLRLLLATSGIHRLILWRWESRAWLGDGVRAVFELPRPWKLAIDGQAPQGRSASSFEPVFRFGLLGSPLTFSLQSPAIFDGGNPATGEVWVRQGGGTIKLGSPPPAGTRLYGSIVPAFPVLIAPDGQETTIQRVTREPKSILFLEV